MGDILTQIQDELDMPQTLCCTARAPSPALPRRIPKDIAELSRDMVLKEQQIEVLIASLPGLDKSEAEQVARMKELEKELEGLEGERLRAVEEKEALVKKVEGKILKAGKMGS
ncbi:RNA polymerase II mediator complex subunit [Didymosphaeria variabile]|uniref:Mediator of RNA polymerase II transcription subunit 21 n=1 Tax=Didymosphaeria variabile TaxID=1932322 RepID=A0A9W9CBB7_9PLEO|nr:RNA polymerase II mediator complex subunit [Didymosphaeria variabile]KAJ4353544.1 RNA polymerase II mediator complex subunit [Didymosphaeria variabile]